MKLNKVNLRILNLLLKENTKLLFSIKNGGILMSTNTEYYVSPQVHRTIYQYSLYKFLKTNISNYDEFIKEANINISNEYYYNKLLDKAIDNSLISSTQVEQFLINELNYGMLKNLYIYVLQDTTHLEDVDNIILYIKSLNRFYNVSNAFSDFPFINKINQKSERNKTDLVYCNLSYDENNNVSSIYLLFSKGILYNSSELNYYVGIEINVKLKLLVVKLRDHLDDLDREAKMHKVQDDFKQNMVNCFSLGSTQAAPKIQSLVHNMTFDLTNKVLSPVISKIDAKLDSLINEQLLIWNSAVIDNSVELTPKDTEGVKLSILNNYYRLYMQNVVGKISKKDLIEKYKVSGYLRTVKFVDDTIGEGKAKSSDAKESLLDTSIYYDIKTRLDQSQSIKFSTIYWIDVPNTKVNVGTTFHIEPNGRFKCNMLPNYFNKEMCDYVLQKIAEYLPT